MNKKIKLLLLTNEESKQKILENLKKIFNNADITVKTFSKPGLSANFKFRKNYFDYIFNFRSYLILSSENLNLAKVASINFHPAPPKYRGRGGINYALYNNEKKYGVTAHIMAEKIDYGPIILVKHFKIPKNSTVEKLFYLTSKNLYLLASVIFKKINKDNKNLDIMLKNGKKYQWSKKISNTKDMNKFYKINIQSKKSVFLKKIRATNYKIYKPYLQIHGLKFFLK